MLCFVPLNEVWISVIRLISTSMFAWMRSLSAVVMSMSACSMMEIPVMSSKQKQTEEPKALIIRALRRSQRNSAIRLKRYVQTCESLSLMAL